MSALPLDAEVDPVDNPTPTPYPRRPSASSSSSHALDVQFEARSFSSASSDDSVLEPYTDIDGQMELQKADADKKHDLKHTIWTVLRGRAMPLKPLSISVLWAIIATVGTYFTRIGFAPHEAGDCRWWCTPLAVDGNALSYVGFALFLLTSFRVSEAYARYMEGIRVWTGIEGTISSFAKYAVQAFQPGCFHRHDRERILGFLAAFPVALKRELRNERDLRELRNVLSAEDLTRLQNAPSMPSYCLYVLSAYCLEAKRTERKLPQSFLVHLIKWIADLAGSADQCNQIRQMPAPYSYTTHLNTFLSLWLLFLPFALVETTGWGTIVIVSFISYGILGVVANAAELENPFGSDYNDLPLGRICQRIQQTVVDTYHASRKHREVIVRAVADEDLRSDECYWLRKHPKKETV